jgi:hypothetical protein
MMEKARRASMIGREEAATLTDNPNIRQKRTRSGNWLTREQAKELLAVPDRSTWVDLDQCDARFHGRSPSKLEFVNLAQRSI